MTASAPMKRAATPDSDDEHSSKRKKLLSNGRFTSTKSAAPTDEQEINERQPTAEYTGCSSAPKSGQTRIIKQPVPRNSLAHSPADAAIQVSAGQSATADNTNESEKHENAREATKEKTSLQRDSPSNLSKSESQLSIAHVCESSPGTSSPARDPDSEVGNDDSFTTLSSEISSITKSEPLGTVPGKSVSESSNLNTTANLPSDTHDHHIQTVKGEDCDITADSSANKEHQKSTQVNERKRSVPDSPIEENIRVRLERRFLLLVVGLTSCVEQGHQDTQP